jgi:hypothetical protein
MKNLLKITMHFALIFAIGCGAKSEKTEMKNMAAPPISKPEIFSVLDSLNAYVEKDSFEIGCDRLDAVLFWGKANGQKFGIWAVADSFLLFYHLFENQWVRTDSIWFDLYAHGLSIADLNGDGLFDASVCKRAGVAGNLVQTVFLFDQISKTFKYCKFFDGLANAEYEKVGHCIKSGWFTGLYACKTKWKHKIYGDSLALERGVTFCPEGIDSLSSATLEIFKELDNQLVTVKPRKGNADKLWEIFQKTLWDSSDKF